MKKVVWSPVIVGVLAALAAGAGEQTTRPSTQPTLVAQVEEMKAVLRLTDEQLNKMQDLIDRAEKEKKALTAEYKAVTAEYDKAAAANDEDAMKAAMAKVSELFRRQRAIESKAAQDIDALLTDPQRAQWIDHKYLLPVLKRYKNLNLTEEQLSRIEREFNKRYEGLDKSQPFFWASLDTQLGMIIERNVLTDDQRRKYLADSIRQAHPGATLTDAEIEGIKERAISLLRGMTKEETINTPCKGLQEFSRKDVGGFGLGSRQ
jgi:hypothetical protein